MSEKLKVGQIIRITQDMVLESALGGKEIRIPKGTRGIIGFDKMVHYQGGYIQPVGKKIELDEKHRDLQGLADYLYYCLDRYCNIEDYLEPEDVMEVKDTLREALFEIGM